MDDLRLVIATYEALQSELDEIKAEVAILKEALRTMSADESSGEHHDG